MRVVYVKHSKEYPYCMRKREILLLYKHIPIYNVIFFLLYGSDLLQGESQIHTIALSAQILHLVLWFYNSWKICKNSCSQTAPYWLHIWATSHAYIIPSSESWKKHMPKKKKGKKSMLERSLFQLHRETFSVLPDQTAAFYGVLPSQVGATQTIELCWAEWRVGIAS